MKRIALALFLMCATSAFAQQYGSEYRKEYEKEVNGPHGECTTKWDHIASGIDYRKITCLGDEDDVDVHAFKISQEFFKLDVAYVTNGSSAKSEAGKREARFVMNANFFQRDKTPIGVIVRSGTQLQPAQSSSWQSVFLIDADGKPRIVTVSQWSRYKKGAQMAVQAGPRTVVAEHTNQINKGYAAARCGVCIQRNGDIVFFATPQERKFKAHEIARVTRRSEVDGGLRCRDAMLFDGGHSTQFFVEGDDRKFSQSGDPVPVFVFATRK